MKLPNRFPKREKRREDDTEPFSNLFLAIMHLYLYCFIEQSNANVQHKETDPVGCTRQLSVRYLKIAKAGFDP